MMSFSKEKVTLVNELYSPARKNFVRRHVIVKGLFDLFQADLADLQKYSAMNGGFKYILCVIDVFSKFTWTEPLKSKKGIEVTSAFAKILRKTKSPKNLQTDEGKEFFNSHFQELMKKHKINHYFSYSVLKASVVERFNRTIKTMLWKRFALQGNYKWVKILPELVNTYNHTRHRTISMPPARVNKSNEKRVLSNSYNYMKIAPPAKFQLNSLVRISKYKQLFRKGYEVNWTAEVFKIRKVQATNPVSYLLEDLKGEPVAGAFYGPELLKTSVPDIYLVEKIVRTKGKGSHKQFLARWWGFSSEHDSWIKKSDLV